jgi:hypothetical protein
MKGPLPLIDEEAVLAAAVGTLDRELQTCMDSVKALPPGMDGRELLQRIREFGPAIRAVLEAPRHSHGDMAQSAEEPGIGERTIYRKLSETQPEDPAISASLWGNTPS